MWSSVRWQSQSRSPAATLQSRSSAGASVSRQPQAAVIRSEGTSSGSVITRGLLEQVESLPAAIQACGLGPVPTYPSLVPIRCRFRLQPDADLTAFRYPDPAPN